MTDPYPSSSDSVKPLSEADIDNLEWARNFMNKYERKKKNGRLPGKTDTLANSKTSN